MRFNIIDLIQNFLIFVYQFFGLAKTTWTKKTPTPLLLLFF